MTPGPRDGLLGRMQTALLRSSMTTLHPGDLVWRSKHLDESALAEQVDLVEVDGEIRGWCWTHDSGAADLFHVDDDPATMQVLWAAVDRAAGRHRYALVDPIDLVVVDGLTDRGWTCEEVGPILRHGDPAGVTLPAVPAGLRVTAMDDPSVDRASRVSTHASVFTKRPLQPAWYDRARRTWPYRPDTDVVVVDEAGAVVAFAIGWVAPNGIGAVEPLGVAERMRGRGLGTLVMAAVTRALGRAGAREVWVATSGDVATRTYLSAGYARWREEAEWTAPPADA